MVFVETKCFEYHECRTGLNVLSKFSPQFERGLFESAKGQENIPGAFEYSFPSPLL